MANYVLIFTGGGMPESEEEQAAVLAAWGAWYAELGEAVANPGNPFSPAAKSIASDGTVTDGPIGTMASGYTVLEADSMESAVGMAKKCPMLQGNGQITVYETFPM
jgi:hypothetical protein